jgi:hypothetical protein
MWKVGRLE